MADNVKDGQVVSGSGISYINQFPAQRVASKDKIKRSWFKPCVDYVIRQAYANNNKLELRILYDAARGNIDKETYKYVLNPFSSTNPKLQNFPGEIRNYDIITPIWNHILGEFSKMINNYQVLAANPDSVSKMLLGKNKMLYSILAQSFINGLNENGIETGVPTKEVPEPPSAVKDYDRSWKDSMAMIGQEALDYIILNTKTDIKMLNAFYDFMVSGEVYSYKEVYKDDVATEVVSPLEYYPISNGELFVEDHDMGCRIYRRSLNQIVDRFRDELDEEERTYLDMLVNSYTSIDGSISVPLHMVMGRNNVNAGSSTYYDFLTTVEGMSANGEITFVNNSRMVLIYHVVWKSETNKPILTYMDTLTGKEVEVEVDETYKLDKEHGDIKLVDNWINEVWECWRIGGHAEGIYLSPRPILCQRNEMNNSSKVKLPYNGKQGLVRNSGNCSWVKRLMPYQALYNIYHLQRERAVAKNIGKIIVIPKGIMANDDEISQEETIYYIKADGRLYVDETKPHAQLALNSIKAVDTSDYDYILALGKLIIEVKDEAWDAVGMNRQRFGDTYASDGKANTEQAIFRSSIMTAPYYEIFNRYRESEYQAYIDYSKVAWINGKKADYINSDGREVALEINGRDWAFSDVGVFVKNITTENDKFNKLSSLAFSAAQNGQFDIAVEAIDATNTAKLRALIHKFNEIEKAREDAKQQFDANTQKEVQQIVSDRENAIIAADLEMTKMKVDGAIAVAEINAGSKREALLLTGEKSNEPSTEYNIDEELSRDEQRRKDREETNKQILNLSKQSMDKYKTDTAMAIAKENKNKYDSKSK